MTAKEMFEALGWELGELNVYERDDILYYRKKEGSAEYDLIFFFEDKTYGVDGFTKGYGIRYNLNAQEHLAITQQMKELGWLEDDELDKDFWKRFEEEGTVIEVNINKENKNEEIEKKSEEILEEYAEAYKELGRK